MKYPKLTSRKATVLVAAGLMIIGSASAALAANGSNFVLGVMNNSATLPTRLVGTLDGSALILSNPSTGVNSTPLDLRATAGRPPMRVNSNVKVSNLNADSLDGLDSTAFLGSNKVRADGDHAGSFIDDFTGSGVPVASTTFTAPSAGFAMLTGSLSAEEDCSLTGRGNLFYDIRIDGTSVFSSSYELGQWAQCDSAEPGNIGASGAATAVVPVSAGSHTVELVLSEVGSGSFVLGRSVTSVFVPNGSGDPAPSGPAASQDNPNQQKH